MRVVALRKLDDKWAIGGHGGFGLHGAFDAPAPDVDVSYFHADLGLHARLDLRRFAAQSWLAYPLGFRSVDDGGAFVKTQVAFHGSTLGAAFLVRFGLGNARDERNRTFEIGPYVELGRFAMLEEARDTEFREDGMVSNVRSIGVVVQLWGYGSRP